MLSKTLRTYLNEQLHQWFPAQCSQCKVLGTVFCEPCASRLKSKIHIRDIAAYPHFFLSFYDDELQGLFHALKYELQKELLPFIQQLLDERADELRTHLVDVDCWQAVPLHPKRVMQRGFNPVLEIFSSTLNGLPLKQVHLIHRQKNSKALHTLNPKQREAELQHAFALDEKALERLDCKHLVLVDDIVTTGSTMQAIATLLKEAKPSIKISCLSIAYTKKDDRTNIN